MLYLIVGMKYVNVASGHLGRLFELIKSSVEHKTSYCRERGQKKLNMSLHRTQNYFYGIAMD